MTTKRFSVLELEGLLSGTTPGEWSEEKIGTVFRSTSVSGECGRKVLMVEVKDDDGRPHSDCQRKNAVLMVQARNLATELLELKQRVAWMESTNNFDATRLRRLATICGVSLGNESDEFVLNCAGTILGSICRVVEGMMKRTADHDIQAQTARRCAEIAKSEPRVWPKDLPDTTPDPQTRIADKILAEFGLTEATSTYRDTFDVDHPGESGAGIAHFTDVVRIEVESGDPGGGPNEFMEHMLDALKEWYDGARVTAKGK